MQLSNVSNSVPAPPTSSENRFAATIPSESLFGSPKAPLFYRNVPTALVKLLLASQLPRITLFRSCYGRFARLATSGFLHGTFLTSAACLIFISVAVPGDFVHKIPFRICELFAFVILVRGSLYPCFDYP